jgi:hypothetical protein
MKRCARMLLIAPLAFVLAGADKKKIPLLSEPIMICERQVKTENGYVQITRRLSPNGTLMSVTGSWVYRTSKTAGDTAFQAGWHALQGAELDLSNGWFAIDFDTNSAAAKQALRGKKYAVELATSDRPRQMGWHLRGRVARFNDFAHGYPDASLDWGDVAAMARGADRLFVAARDEEGIMLRSIEIDRAMFSKALGDVAALDELMRRDKTDCHLEEGDIVVT